MLTVEDTMRPTYAQDWNLSIQRSFLEDYLIEVRYVGTRGNAPAAFHRGESGGVRAGRDRRRTPTSAASTPGAARPSGPCDFASVGLLVNATSSTYHAGQVSLSRRFSTGAGFQLSYWYSKALDYASSLNLSGSAPQLVAGENDLPQNPFDWNAEHGPSLFDARHRVTLSFLYEIPGFGRFVRACQGAAGRLAVQRHPVAEQRDAVHGV